MSLIIGIDLGTTNTCAAIFRNDQVEIIKTPEGEFVTPSVVFYDVEESYVGKEALKRGLGRPGNLLFDAKRFIGRLFSDECVRNAPIQYPFIPKRGDHDACVLEVKLSNGEACQLRPEEVSALVLMRIKNDAQVYLQEDISDVVITVPAYFSTQQRKATEHAARIARLNPVKLLNEPTAAALAYFKEDHLLEKKNVLVYDLGGGTFDVSIVRFEGGEGKVIAVGGDSYLGGRNFDDNLVAYCIDYMEKTETDFSLKKQDPHSKRRLTQLLRSNCENAKKELSAPNVDETTIDFTFKEMDMQIEITREMFERMNLSYFKRTIELLDETLKEANITKSDIHEIVLVGGSTRIPKIEQLVSDYFDAKQLNKIVNRDEGVAIGAALQGSLLSTNQTQKRKFVISGLRDVIPLSLGIEVDSKTDDNFSILIKRNTVIPVNASKVYKTTTHHQTRIVIDVYEGIHSNVQKNFKIGQLVVDDITPKKAGKVTVKVVFWIDSNGMLTVSASQRVDNSPTPLKISLVNSRLSERDVSEMQVKIRPPLPTPSVYTGNKPSGVGEMSRGNIERNRVIPIDTEDTTSSSDGSSDEFDDDNDVHSYADNEEAKYYRK